MISICLLILILNWPDHVTGPGYSTQTEWDVDGDGDVDLKDWSLIEVYCMESCSCDM